MQNPVGTASHRSETGPPSLCTRPVYCIPYSNPFSHLYVDRGGRRVYLILWHNLKWVTSVSLVDVEIAIERKDTLLTQSFRGGHKRRVSYVHRGGAVLLHEDLHPLDLCVCRVMESQELIFHEIPEKLLPGPPA